MPWGDGIPHTRSFSLTDIHDFDQCIFRFLVRHELERKREIDESSPKMCIGTILDEAIKLYHLSAKNSFDPNYIDFLVRGAVRHIRESVEKKGERSFYYKHSQYLSEPLIQQAVDIFKNYYIKLDGKIKKSIGRVGFCEYIFESNSKKVKLWGGPDTYEEGEDGVPEVADYKYHEDPKKGVLRLDMDLMPKMYMVLSAGDLLKIGYKKARFVIRQWNNPKDETLKEEFDLNSLGSVISFLQSKIEPILENKKISFCERSFCLACSSEKREEYLNELENLGFVMVKFRS